MDVAVLGATGRTGVRVVEQALARGHGVRALVRTSEKARLLPDDTGLEVIEGDLLDAGSVARTISGTAAVINVAGPVKGGPSDLQQRAIDHVLEAMAAAGVERLVTLTGAGVRHPDDRPKMVDRLFHALLSLLEKEMLRDSEAYVERVRSSTTRWTVVRVPRLTDDESGGDVRVVPNVGSGSGTKLGRADLAAFLLDEMEKEEHLGGMPVVSW